MLGGVDVMVREGAKGRKMERLLGRDAACGSLLGLCRE